MLYEIKVPEAGFSITEGTVVQWHKNVGEKAQEEETLVSVETDKVVVEIPALCTGILIEIKHEVGETVPIGAVLGVIRTDEEERVIPAEPKRDRISTGQERSAATAGTTDLAQEKRKISPLARDIAKREGIDLSRISVGSGPGGRIVKEDILRLVQKKEAVEPEAKKAPTRVEAQEKVKFTGWRKVIADRMISSARNVPQASTIMEMDVTEIARVITSTRGAQDHVRLTYLPFLILIFALISLFCYTWYRKNLRLSSIAERQ